MSIIYWDFDGTLVWSEHLWSSSVFKALNETNDKNGVLFTDIRKCMATGFTWHTPDNDYTAFKNERWWDFMNEHIYRSYLSLGIDNETAYTATQKVRGIIKKRENYNLFPDTVSTLRKMRNRGHKNIILSNNFPDLYEVIEKIGIEKYFDGFVISAVEGYDKPRKELFDIAKSYNKNNEPMYMVGDSINADIIGGRNAGMTTIYVHKGFCEEADYCFENLKDIVDLVD